MGSTGIDYVAWWGAGLSTLLAALKLLEFWSDRFRIDVGCTLSTDSEMGNEIFIRNLSPKPIILSHWELLYGSRAWPFLKLETFQTPDFDSSDIKIEPHSSKVFKFIEAQHFDWGKDKIYIKLYIVGRRQVLKKIYG